MDQAKGRNGERIEEIVAIGTSTGGPRTLELILTRLTPTFPFPILIVQHMPSGFTKAMAERLNQITPFPVSEGRQGERIRASHVYIAPGNRHMRVRRMGIDSLYIDLDEKTPPKGGHRPSVDLLFESLSSLAEVRKTIILLTGMGNDGTEGLRKVKALADREVVAIGESEESCAVYGMPKAAHEAGLINRMLKKEEIADYLNLKASGGNVPWN